MGSTYVEVYSQFEGSWVPGFEVEREEHDDSGAVTKVFLRRTADKSVLPTPFMASQVRATGRPRRRPRI